MGTLAIRPVESVLITHGHHDHIDGISDLDLSHGEDRRTDYGLPASVTVGYDGMRIELAGGR